MIFKLLTNLFPKSHNKVIEVTEQLFLIAERKQGEQWHLSYFFTGSYGNYLIGRPLDWSLFNEFFTSKGGVYLLFPTEKFEDDHKEKDLSLFSRFGTSWVVPDEDSWPHIPTKDVCFLPGFKIDDMKKSGSKYDIKLVMADVKYTNSDSAVGKRVNLPRQHHGSMVSCTKEIKRNIERLN